MGKRQLRQKQMSMYLIFVYCKVFSVISDDVLDCTTSSALSFLFAEEKVRCTWAQLDHLAYPWIFQWQAQVQAWTRVPGAASGEMAYVSGWGKGSALASLPERPEHCFPITPLSQGSWVSFQTHTVVYLQATEYACPAALQQSGFQQNLFIHPNMDIFMSCML